MEEIQPENQLTKQPDRNIMSDLTIDSMNAMLNQINMFQSLVRSTLKENHDYGTIPGCGKNNTLFKAGAEKIAMLLGVSIQYECINRVEDFDKNLFFYTFKCYFMKKGHIWREGEGNCSNKEKKFSYEWVALQKIPPGYTIETLEKKEMDGKYGKYYLYKIEENGATKANTLLKMAKKRALIDCALSAGCLSDLFTQDVEDFGEVVDGKFVHEKTEKEPQKSTILGEKPTLDKETIASIKDRIEKATTKEELAKVIILINDDNLSTSSKKELMDSYREKLKIFTTNANGGA